MAVSSSATAGYSSVRYAWLDGIVANAAEDALHSTVSMRPP